MKISALEHQKQIGVLNLDHIKKKKKQQELNTDTTTVPQLAHVNPNDLKPVEIGGKKALKPVLVPPSKLINNINVNDGHSSTNNNNNNNEWDVPVQLSAREVLNPHQNGKR